MLQSSKILVKGGFLILQYGKMHACAPNSNWEIPLSSIRLVAEYIRRGRRSFDRLYVFVCGGDCRFYTLSTAAFKAEDLSAMLEELENQLGGKLLTQKATPAQIRQQHHTHANSLLANIFSDFNNICNGICSNSMEIGHIRDFSRSYSHNNKHSSISRFYLIWICCSSIRYRTQIWRTHRFIPLAGTLSGLGNFCITLTILFRHS